MNVALDVYKDWLGIPEGPRPPDHYVLLRLKQFEDSVDKIRSNYKKLNTHVRKYATGQYTDESQALLNELAKAMLCLTDAERKHEYDVSLGRVVEEVQAGPRTMDVVLLEQKQISKDQAQQARDFAEQSGLELRDAFVQLKIVPPDVAAQALAQELGLSYVDLSDMLPDDSILDQVPRQVVKQYSILPLFVDNGMLLVACVHQIDHTVEEELRLRFGGMPVRSVLAAPLAINQAIAKYYAAGMRKDPAAAAGKTSAKAPAASERKAAPARRQPLTPDEISERRKLGIVIFNASFILAYLVDWLLVTPRVFFDGYTFLLFLAIPAVAAAICWQVFWRR
jgi:hypothetical protein